MNIAASLIDDLRNHSHTLAFCESLTAGLACATVAGVPGASDVLRGGLVTYATELKGTLAGVPEHVLARHGAVSPVTARHMASGARDACGSDWGVALTGVAGPDPQEGKPVGEVYVAVAGPGRVVSGRAVEIVDKRFPALTRFALVDGEAEPVRVLAGDRQGIRLAAVTAALVALERELRLWEQTEGVNR